MKNNSANIEHFPSWVIICALSLIPIIAGAKITTVENNISVSASSGGNVAGEEGEIVESKAESEIFVETRANGEVIESYDSRETRFGATPVADLHSQQFENSFETEDGSVRVETSIAADAGGGHRMSTSTVGHPASVVSSVAESTTTATGVSETQSAGADEREPAALAAPQSLLKRAFTFIAYVFSFKWIF